jgi:hypothetical protein
VGEKTYGSAGSITTPGTGTGTATHAVNNSATAAIIAHRVFIANGGKNAHVRVQRVNQPGVTETRMWGAYEKVSVKRA